MDSEARITLRLPKELHQRLMEEAKRQERSVNGQIVYLLKQALDQAKASAQGSADDRTQKDG